MAQTKCPHCENTRFETTVQQPKNSNFKLVFLQCGDCGAPFGVLPYYDERGILVEISNRLKEIERRIQQVGPTPFGE
jgi:hypothetical protein